MNSLNKDQIKALLPHRDPMLLIDALYDIKHLHSATAIVHVKKIVLYKVILDQPVMPGVLIVESFGRCSSFNSSWIR